MFFEMDDLIPLAGRPYMISLLFDEFVDKPYIVNPDGSGIGGFNPHFWDSGTRWGGGSYIIYLPGLSLDFSGGSKRLVFEWDFADWIEVYDNGTPSDLHDDLVVVNLDRPFPIELKVEPYADLTPVQGDGQPPPAVSNLNIRFFSLLKDQIYLKWANPSIVDYEQTHIIKKEGSAPTGIDDGENVYSGTFPMFEDDDVRLHTDYYYLVVVEDEEGYFGSGEIINIRTDPPFIDEVWIERDDDETASLAVGEEMYFYVYGFSRGDGRAVVAQWIVTGDIGSFEYDYGRRVRFIATKPGKGTITASHGDVSDSISIEVTP